MGARALPAGPVAPGARLRAPSSAARLAGLTAAGSLALYLLLPAGLGDDTYAALDWGRELRDGHLPSLEGRTFHPLAVALGAVTSLFGSAAPTIMVLLSLASLVLLACGAARILTLLGFRQPVPAAAAAMVIVSPMLPVLAFAGYNNLPFAALVLWAIAFELQERRRPAWLLLVIAGLIRPEGWAFLVGYGVLRWWRRGRPANAREWLPIAALALAPMVIWAVVEWVLFGDPLYSFHNTAEGAVPINPNNSAAQLFPHLQHVLTWVVLIVAILGVPVVATVADRERARTVLALSALAPLTIVVLVVTRSPIPTRHLSVVVSLAIVFAAAGATVPARLLGRTWLKRGKSLVLAEAAGAIAVVAIAALSSAGTLERYADTMRETHATGKAVRASVSPQVRAAVSTVPPHSIALLGSQAVAEWVWALHVPFDRVDPDIGPQTQMVIEPSPATWAQLNRLLLTDKARVVLGKRWRLVENGPWQVYASRS